MSSDFLPGDRLPIELIEQQRSIVIRDEIFREILEKLPYPFLILNSFRQIIYYNKALVDSLPDLNDKFLLGQRPGEALRCIHSNDNEGCGTTIFCRTCGAAKAIAASLAGRQDIQECRITTFEEDAYDFRVWTYPKTINGERFSFFTLIDISHEKRREVLERIFYHDILNTANGIIGFLHLYFSENEQKDELIYNVLNLSQILVDEINSQRIISYAESGTLEINYEKFLLKEMVNEVISLFKSLIDFKEIKVQVDLADELELTTDKTLLRRIIINLLKNAIEASTNGCSVKISASKENSQIKIKVHNQQVMPEEVKLQIFKRSFSTKGKGRGLGTYSIKLLTEKFLNGVVTFTSEDGFGTEFVILITNQEDRQF